MKTNINPFIQEIKKMDKIKRTTLTDKELKTLKEAIKIITAGIKALLAERN